MSKNPDRNLNAIDVRFYYIPEALHNGKTDIAYCESENMVAELLTKPSDRITIAKFKSCVLANYFSDDESKAGC